MENQVDGVHTARQTEGERVSTCLSNDFKRSKVFLHKFLRWSSGSDVVRLNTLSLMMKSRDGARHLLADTEYQVCVAEIVFLSSLRSTMKSQAQSEARSCSRCIEMFGW